MNDQPTEHDTGRPLHKRTLRRVDSAVVNRQTRQVPRASRIAPISDESSILKPSFLWWTFCQWWKVAIPVGLLLASLAAAGVVLSYEPDYKASALIMVEDSAPYIAFAGAGPSGKAKKYVETQVELLRSPVVLGPVLSRPEVARLDAFEKSKDRLQTMKRHLRISRIGRSELYQVSYTSKSPKAAADIANAVVAEYLSIQSAEELQRTQRVIDILEEQRHRRSLEVERLCSRVVKLGKEVTGRDPFAQNSITDLNRVGNPSVTLFQKLAQLDVQIELVKAEMAAAEDLSLELHDHDEKSGLLALEIAATVSNHPQVIETENVIAQLQLQMTGIESLKKRGKADADWISLQEEEQRYVAALGETKEELKKEVKLRLAEMRDQTRRKNLAKLQGEFDKLTRTRDIISQKFNASVAELQKNGGKSIELEFARAQLQREQQVFELIASRMLSMQTELKAPTRVRLRLPADKPKRPLTDLPIKMIVMACSSAFAAPFGLALLREISVQRISSVDQLSRESHLRILGEIPRFPIKQVAIRVGSKISGKLRRQMFLYNESIDSLRTSLRLASDHRSEQLLVVTSAAAGEGKTSLATSLAMSIANATKSPTLIMDADMRSPDVATVLGIKNGPGLAEVLNKTAELKDVIMRVGETQTYVLPAGRLKGSPHPLFQGGHLEEILAQLREEFTTIIVDTPPLFGGSESLVFAEKADGVILATLSDVSRSKQVNLAIEKLEHVGANVLGAVLNGRSTNSYAYFYGYGHYSNPAELIDS